jgi:hypothetical protein
VKQKPAFGAAVSTLAPFLSLLVVSSITVASVGESEENAHLVPATEPPGAWTLQWTGRTGRTYFVQHSHDLHSWTYLNTIQHGEGAKMLGTSSTGNKYFLRLRHTDIPCVDPATADFDGDGLNNAAELFWLCDPFLADSDSDGFNDGWEIMVGWDPKQKNANQEHLDPDGDGWDNATEHLYKTNPNLADSDEDGLDDPDDADPNDSTIDWPRASEATRVWIPLTGYDPAAHGAPVALSNTGIALFERAVWKAGVWKPLEWQKPGPELSYPDQTLPLQTTLRAIRSLDLADDGRVLGSAELLFEDLYGGDHGAPGTSLFAVQWTEQAGSMVMEITGEHVSGGLDIESFELLPKAAGVSPEGVLFTLRKTGENVWQWGRHGPESWKNTPDPTFSRQAGEFVPDLYQGGVSTVARHTLRGGSMGVSNSGSGNRLLAAAGTSDLPDGPGYACGSLADDRAAFVSTANGTSGLQLRPRGNTLDFRPVPKLAGAAAFNAQGEAISRDGRFWQNGKWLTPVSEENTPPSGTMHLHDLNDHGVMLASAGAPAGNGQTGPQYGNQAGLISPIGLLADTNRDGQINKRDEEGKGEFTRQRGAFFNVNFDNDNPGTGAGNDADPDAITWWMGATGPDKEHWEIDNEADVADITPFQVSLPKLPEGSRLYLRVGHQEQRMAAHFFYKREAGRKAFWGGVTTPPTTVWADGDADPLDIEITEGVLGSLASPEEAGHFEFGLEGLVLRGMPLPGGVGTSGTGCFGGLLTLKLEVAIPGQEERLVSAPITLRVAPWLLIPNTQPAEAVYVSEIPDTNGQPKAALDIPGATLVSYQGSHWLQDHAEIGYTQRPGIEPIFLTFGTPYSTINSSIHGQQPVPESWVKDKFLGPNSGVFHLTNLPDDRGEDWGGNIEVLPPTVPQKEDEPLGTIIVGHGEMHQMSNALLHFLEAQEYQPVKRVDVDFASVRHVDEVISVGANGVIYYNDPKLALDLLREKFPTVDDKVKGCFFDREGVGRGTRKSLGYAVADPNHKFLILNEPPETGFGPGFAQAYENGTVRTVMLGHAYGGQLAKIDGFSTAVNGEKPGYPAGPDGIGGKLKVELGAFWQPGRSETPPDWSSPALLPWGHATTSSEQTIWHEVSPAGTNLLFIKGQPLEWLQGLPAVITVGELLADQAFVDFNETAVRQKIQSVTGKLTGYTLKPLPALFYKETTTGGNYYAHSLTPNPVNMQWQNTKAWLPKQYSASAGANHDEFMKKINETIEANGGTTAFIEDWESFHIRFGEVHCGSNVRRTPPAAWWEKLE